MIRLIRPYLSFEEVEAEFREVFESGIFTKGTQVNRFVEAIEQYTGARHAFLTTSATTALSCCLKLLEVERGDEVIVADFSFPATANVVEDLGAVPVFADVDLQTFNMMPEQVEQKITPKTKAVIFVDALGNPTGITQIRELCQRHNIPLIEDAACAIGSSENGLKCGNIADLTCFSFHPRKLINTGEGGAITTNNPVYAEKLKIKLNHGAIVEQGKFRFVDFGYNYRLPEIQSVMGRFQLLKLDGIVYQRNLALSEYKSRLAPMGFISQYRGDDVVHNVQSVVFVVPERISRDELIKHLYMRGIESTIGTYCLSNTDYYRRNYNNVQMQAAHLESRTITLPCYEGVDVLRVSSAIADFANR